MAAIELGSPYYLYNPAQTDYVALNKDTDSNFVGYVSDITGLDDSEVRENALNINAGDGGVHGRFWRGRRPWTIAGFIMPMTPVTARSAAVEHMENILNQCLASDGTLMWIQSNGITKYIPFRKQQPFRDTKGQGNVERDFMVSGVCADWRIYNWTQQTIQSAIVANAGVLNTNLPLATSQGTADAPFTFVMTGPTTGFTLTNSTTGKSIIYLAAVPSGDTLTLDLTGRYPTVNDGSGNQYGNIDFVNSDWSTAVSEGANQFVVITTDSGSTTNAELLWRDAYA
jgi:hypothetical protein